MAEPETIIVWQQNNAEVERDVLDMWARYDALPANANPALRLKAVAAVVYIDGKIAGVASANIGPEPKLGGYKFANWRTFIAPDYRDSGLGRHMSPARLGMPVIEKWAIEHPEEGVSGVMTVMENTELFTRENKGQYRTSNEERDEIAPVIGQSILKPEAPNYELAGRSPLVFIGYNNRGKATFVRWFPHILIKVVKPQEM